MQPKTLQGLLAHFKVNVLIYFLCVIRIDKCFVVTTNHPSLSSVSMFLAGWPEGSQPKTCYRIDGWLDPSTSQVRRVSVTWHITLHWKFNKRSTNGQGHVRSDSEQMAAWPPAAWPVGRSPLLPALCRCLGQPLIPLAAAWWRVTINVSSWVVESTDIWLADASEQPCQGGSTAVLESGLVGQCLPVNYVISEQNRSLSITSKTQACVQQTKPKPVYSEQTLSLCTANATELCV